MSRKLALSPWANATDSVEFELLICFDELRAKQKSLTGDTK
jgi:hypothetical protein